MSTFLFVKSNKRVFKLKDCPVTQTKRFNLAPPDGGEMGGAEPKCSASLPQPTERVTAREGQTSCELPRQTTSPHSDPSSPEMSHSFLTKEQLMDGVPEQTPKSNSHLDSACPAPPGASRQKQPSRSRAGKGKSK